MYGIHVRHTLTSSLHAYQECRTLTATETYPKGIPPQKKGVKPEITKQQKRQAFGSRDVSYPHSKDSGLQLGCQMQQLWRGIVNTYTQCSLTYPSDRLIALSGVVKFLEIVLSDEYCAGLWKSRLVTELAWRCSRDEFMQVYTYDDMYTSKAPQNFPTPYRAPSWSWACMDSQVDLFEGNDTTPMVDIIDCDVTPATADRTGAIVSTNLRLRGSLATFEFLTRLPYGPDGEAVFNSQWESPGLIYNKSIDFEPPSPQKYCLPLFSYTAQSAYDGRHGDPLIFCLVLSPTGHGKGQFQRIGHLAFSPTQLNTADWEDEDAANQESMEYETACGHGRYVISII
jgi:hypothetical protein